MNKLRMKLCIIASNWIECLGVDLTKEVQDFYTENHKMLLKETK